MQRTYDDLAASVLSTLQSMQSDGPAKYIVLIAGPPGAGKSTLAHQVCARINHARPDTAVVVPMDGVHLYKRELQRMPDPEDAFRRRGAPYTFSPELLLTKLQDMQSKGHGKFASFDHGVGDPVENAIEVRPEHRVVLVEGNYLLMWDHPEWRLFRDLAYECWYVDVDMDQAMDRVRARHIRTGKTPEEARIRVETNDRLNAELIVRTKKFATRVIPSISDDAHA